MVKRFFKYSIPSMLAMFVTSLYTVIDGIFVGQGIGDVGLAAVNMVLPITILYFGTATMIAVGGGAIVSKHFGEGRDKEAQKVFGETFKFIIFVSLTLSVIAFFFNKVIMYAVGARGEILHYSSEYLRYYSLFCSANLIGIVLNSFVRNDGNPRIGMIANILGAITNIILDYVFIFIFHWGIQGAALATGVGQILTVLVLITHFLFKKGKLRFNNPKVNKNILKKILKVGFPSFLGEIVFSMIIFLYNAAIILFIGEETLSAFSIINYINSNIYMIILGMNFGVQPLISYAFGEKNSYNMLYFHRLSNKFSFILTLIYVIICLVFGRELISIFTFNKFIIDIAYTGLNVSNLGFFILGLNLTTAIYYQAIEVPRYSNILCIFRSFIFLPISLVVFGKLFGVMGIWSSLIASEGLSFIFINLIIRIKDATKRFVV